MFAFKSFYFNFLYHNGPYGVTFENKCFITGRNEIVAKVIFLHLSVIHSVHRGGVLSPGGWGVYLVPGGT